MKVLIVFESMFGNTAALARDVMAGLVEGGADVVLADVASVPGPELLGCDLLVLAVPTHALSLSELASRADAVSTGADPVQVATGLREWLSTLETASPGPLIAVFDTRVPQARHLPGSAAWHVGRILRRSGVAVVDRVSFFVEDIPGPIGAGEHERACNWGRGLATIVQPRASSQASTG